MTGSDIGNGLDLMVTTFDMERDGAMELPTALAIGGPDTVEMSSGSLTAFAESGGSTRAWSFRIGAGEVPVIVRDDGGELARDDSVEADGGGTELATAEG